MITAEKRKAIYLLHEQGMEIKEISRKLKISRNTVRAIIRDKGGTEIVSRKTRITLDPDLLKQVYGECDGWIQRVYEKLTQEHAVPIAYSTLTRKLREMEISLPPDQRSGQVPDQPGLEMQNDTSDYKIKLGDTPTKVIAAMLYYRQSKVRYLKFYRSFNRFQMKCFFFEALTYFKYTADQCVIDNTHLAILHGTGKNAVFVPEMNAFAAQFGFHWIAHEKMHSNRKAGNERSFWTVETNFFPGRTFRDLEDLNAQAFVWATETLAHRPLSKTKLIPSELFEKEKPYLKKIPPFVQPPFLDHERGTDQYGYTAFDGNFYWIPGTSLEKVKILQYATSIKIYRHRNLLAEYPLPAYGVKNQKFPGGPLAPIYEPTKRMKPTQDEENRLRTISPLVDAYVSLALQKTTSLQAKHTLIRKIDLLSRNLSPEYFTQLIQRAHHYGVIDPNSLERMARQIVRSDSYQFEFFELDDDGLLSREAYQEGSTTEEPDLSIYEELTNQNDDEDSSDE